MNVALRRAMSVPEFLAWEDRQELRYEFDGVQPLAMVGGTAAHEGIAGNLIAALVSALRGKPCRAFGGGLKIEVAGRIRYPDAFVVCSRVPPGSKLVSDPVVVFEILSPSTASQDLVAKNAEYRATPSIQRYVILQQTAMGATVFSRKGDDWVADIVAGPDAVLRMPEIAVEIPLSDLYADIELVGETEA